jgi:hypothetical protein
MIRAISLIMSLIVGSTASAQTQIPIDEAAKHIGETITVCDKVYGGKFIEGSKTKPTVLNLGGSYPNHKLTILVNSELRKALGGKPEETYLNKNVCVTGQVVDSRGKPEIIVAKTEDIKIDETRQGIEKVEPKK